MTASTPNYGRCDYMKLPNGCFRMRLLDPTGDQIGEVDCDTESDAVEITWVRPLLWPAEYGQQFPEQPIGPDQYDSTLAALERAGVKASNAIFVRKLLKRRDEGSA